MRFYFLAGPTLVEVSKQYPQVVGLPAMVPYLGFGFQQCRWGYRDIHDIVEVVANYRRAGIPLETMYTDIDYMDRRKSHGSYNVIDIKLTVSRPRRQRSRPVPSRHAAPACFLPARPRPEVHPSGRPRPRSRLPSPF